MKRVVLGLVGLTSLALVLGFYPTAVDKPVKDGSGPMAIRIDPSRQAPQTHSPLEGWQTAHPDVLARGDQAQADCLTCHDPAISCNRCHAHVGALEVLR